ncbi:hypothetical protein [Nocardia sp. CDC160]|uniref:hypothetical protein n=1 Tax=Nocardia sp. CDC160 TaxID=3112166 RepID=UPI002DB59CB0|nr:hypothetical protein [Nocardia sp. CDC160]MEC3916025.1 hypothetical protein [Nocardia sp. CDC160]
MSTLIALVACSSPHKGDYVNIDAKPSNYSRQDLCQRFLSFVTDELKASDAHLENSTEDANGKAIEWSSGCHVYRSDLRIIGSLSVYNPQRNGTIQPAQSDFQPIKGFSEKVWMTNDDQFRTQVGQWVSEMSFQKRNLQMDGNPADLDNDKVKKSVEFLIQLTRDIQKS